MMRTHRRTQPGARASVAGAVLAALCFFVSAAIPASAQVADARSGQVLEDESATFREDRPRGPVIVRGGASADPIQNAVEEYQRTGNARTIQQSTFVAYPFGHSQPTLTCAPLRACMIELQPGEVVMAVIAGDTERWLMSQAFTGESGDTPLVVVKPTDFGLTTNLIISTDRRIYELTLDAPPQRNRRSSDQNPQALYTRRIKFYYPDAIVTAFEQGAAAERTRAVQTVPLGADFRLENLNFNYRWDATKNFPFEPEEVFDDGAHTYIKLPASARHDAAPVLFIVDGGERKILNYTLRAVGEGHHYYITDRVIQQGVLVLGQRKKNWLGRVRHSEEHLQIWNEDK